MFIPPDVAAVAAYKEKRCTAREAVERMRRDDTVAAPIATGQPAAFLAALGDRDDWQRLVVFSGLLIEPYSFLTRDSVRLISGFFGPIERMAQAAGGRVDYLPADFLGWARYARRAAPRVVATAAGPMDEHGFFNLGLHAGATFEALLAAAHDPERMAVVEVLHDMPHVYGMSPYGGHRIHVSEVDCVIESDRSCFVLPDVPVSETDRRIAAHVTDLIADGATLQFGIGGIPNSIAQMLANGSKGNFGIHTEMFVDGIMHLHEAGKVTNHKDVFDGFSVATFAAGSSELYRWLDHNRDVVMLPVQHVNDPAIIRRNPHVVSVNGAIAIDLAGQVMADTIGPRQYSGVGGHELFAMGAHDCEDGRSIMCLHSTASVDGTLVSSIVPALPAGTPVTTPRHHVQYVVTEYGVACLDMLTARERRDALLAIAHPAFRDALAAPDDVQSTGSAASNLPLRAPAPSAVNQDCPINAQ